MPTSEHVPDSAFWAVADAQASGGWITAESRAVSAFDALADLPVEERRALADWLVSGAATTAPARASLSNQKENR